MGKIFLSYATADRDAAKKLNNALIEAGCDVWWDETWLGDLDLIQKRIQDGLESTSLTVIVGSRHWLKSRACTWELLYSLALGARARTDRLALVLVDDSDATRFGQAHARRALQWAEGANLADIVEQVRDLAASIPGPPPGGGIERVNLETPFLPGVRHVIRAAPLLDIFDHLRPPLGTLESGAHRQQDRCVVWGMGGAGKSSLAGFFAQQFGPLFDSVMWLNAAGDQVSNNAMTPEDRAVVYRALFDSAWQWAQQKMPGKLALSSLPVGAKARWERMAQELSESVSSDQTLLMIVDDLPAGMDATSVFPKSMSISILVTTRDAELSHQGFASVYLDGFLPEEAMDVFTHAVDPSGDKRRTGVPIWNGHEQDVRDLIELVEGHPLAVDLLAIRLSDGETVASLLDDVRRGEDYFLDASETISLPTHHTPSILSTIAGSIRAYMRTPIEAVPGLLRVLMVLPAGTAVPISDLTALLGASTRNALDVGQHRSVLIRSGDAVSCHSLTRAVARTLWDRGLPPFNENRVAEPELSLRLAQLLFDNLDRLRSADARESARQGSLCLAALEEVKDHWGIQERRMASECLASRARERYRYRTGIRVRADWDLAIRWTDEAKDVLGDSICERFSWWSVEALRGLILAELASQSISPQLTPVERLSEQEAALEVCLKADAARRQLVDQMSEQERAAVNADDILLRSQFNIPGRRLQMAKAYVALDPPNVNAAEGQLTLMDLAHEELIWRRKALTAPNWADIATSVEGRGSAAYHRAVLLDLTSDERMEALNVARRFLIESLRMREQSAGETDACKSLRLIVKTCWAAQCLTDGRDET